MNMNPNGIALNKNTTSTGKLNFPNTLDQYKIHLWGTNKYGFGIADSTLQYSSQGNHSFYNSANNENTFNVNSVGNVYCSGRVGIQNANSLSMLRLGNFL